MAPNVNVPTDLKIKEKDVNAKLQLYGIYSAFANGKVPSNKQIDVAMNSALAWNQLSSPSKKLSTEGQQLVGDLRNVIEQAKILFLTKNQGNVLQDFIWETEQITGHNAKTPDAPVDKDTAKQHGQQTLEGLRTLGTLILSNGQFRKLLNDATVLIRDIAGDAAQKAANEVHPSKEELDNIDKPAEDNTWHDVPDMSKDSLKQKMPFSKKDIKEGAKDVAGDATQGAHPSGSRDPNAAADLASHEQKTGSETGLDAKKGAHNAVESLKHKAEENIPEDRKRQGHEYEERTANYFKSKMPQERRDQTIWRLKKMVVEIQGHQDYQQAIDTLLRLAENYTGHAKNVAGQSAGTVKGAHTDSDLQQAEANLKTLIERFANSTSLDDLFEGINEIYRAADRDPELRGWFQKLNKYIRRCLQEQGYVLQDAATDEWHQIHDKGEFLLRDRYRNVTDHLVDEIKFFADQFDKDPQNAAFAKSINKLFHDLGQNENGKAAFKPHLLKDVSEVIVPGFFKSVRYVPIPRIEYIDPTIECIVENLVLEGDNLAPNQFEFGSDNYWRWGRQQFTSANKNKVKVSVAGIQCDLRDVSYYVKKKQGFPEITDKGVMDVMLGGSGLSFDIEMETADPKNKQRFFKVNKIHVNISGMNIKVKQSNHKLLFKLFKPILLKVMTPVITKVIEKQIRDNIHQLDKICYEVHQEAKRAQRKVKEDPSQAPNIFNSYANAFKNYMTQAKQKKDEVASDKKVNIAITQHDSELPKIKLPGGISTKATEYKDLAAKGDKWESPVFSIGSAKETTNLPKLPEVTRKPHSTTPATLRGPNSGNGSSSGNTGAPSIGQTQGQSTQGFSSQVDQAFGDRNGSATVPGSTGVQNTTLGVHNPVYSGQP